MPNNSPEFSSLSEQDYVTATEISPDPALFEADYINPKPGLILANTYRLEKLLGRGGMGEVWLASHLLLDELRAIKFLLSDYNDESRQRFIQNEAKSALRFQHPNVVRVYDVGQVKNMLYIVMEYVHGSESGFDIRSLLKQKGKLSVSEAGILLQQIAEALAVLHQHNFVHRDVKPANILVTDNNQIKLTDFGLIKDLAASLNLTMPGYGPGTALYLAPEQAVGQPVSASDQYSLGVMLYELLTGRPPFKGSIAELLAQHINAIPRPLFELEPTIPPDVSDVVLKAIAKRPQDRFASVLEFAAAYQAAQGSVAASALSKLDVDTSNEAIAAVPNNLPELTNKFVGREVEIAEIANLVREYTGHLVTLTGVGGSGKTRLALEVAKLLLAEFKDGVFFVPLENITEGATFIRDLSTTLGLKHQQGQSSPETVRETLKNWLITKELLLVLDNFEQLIPQGATLVADLLKTASNLRIIVTSRESLQLSREAEYSVAPLPLPNEKVSSHSQPESFTNYAAIDLFVARARAVRNDFRLNNENLVAVVEICQKLDGLPLAIELAAARVKAYTPPKILERLDLKLLSGGSRDLPTRQQTLHGAIDWSYDLLEQGEQTLFARMSIFAAGCTVEAAETVCNAEGDLEIDIFDGIESLVQKNLLRQWDGVDGERHYGMLQTIREYALEKLVERGEIDEQRRAFADYYLKFVQELEPKLKMGATQVQNFKVLESEYENIRELLYQSLELQKISLEIGLSITISLEYYWRVRGYFSDGWHYIGCALKFVSVIEPLKRAKLLEVASKSATTLGNYSTAFEYGQEALALFRQLEDKRGIASTLVNLAVTTNRQGDYASVKGYFEEALDLYREMNDRINLANCLQNLAVLASKEANWKAAESYFEEALAIDREINERQGIAGCVFNLGILARELADLEKANRYLEEALILWQELGQQYGTVLCLKALGHIATQQGEYTTANNYLQRAMALAQKIGEKREIAGTSLYFGYLALRQNDLLQAAQLFEEALSLAEEINSRETMVLILNGLATVALEQGNWVNSLAYLEKAMKLNLVVQEKTLIAGTLSTYIEVKLKSLAQTTQPATTGNWSYIAQLGGAIKVMASYEDRLLIQEPWRTYYHEGLEKARHELDDATFRQSFQQGQALNIEEAIDLAQKS